MIGFEPIFSDPITDKSLEGFLVYTQKFMILTCLSCQTILIKSDKVGKIYTYSVSSCISYRIEDVNYFK